VLLHGCCLGSGRPLGTRAASTRTHSSSVVQPLSGADEAGAPSHPTTVLLYCTDQSCAQCCSNWYVKAAIHVLLCRGFHVCYIREDSAVPDRVDPKTGAVSTVLRPCHKFRISFDARGPRDDIKVRLAALSGPAVWEARVTLPNLNPEPLAKTLNPNPIFCTLGLCGWDSWRVSLALSADGSVVGLSCSRSLRVLHKCKQGTR
jgi:hypothetical protein